MPFKPHPTDPTKVIYKTSEYWIPKPWQGLTDEERRRYNDRLSGSGVAEEIEAKLKEKNGD